MKRKVTSALLTLSLMLGMCINLKGQTTLYKETTNNTSTANTFAGTANGNMAAGNVSMVPVRSYFPGFTGLILAHTQQWWGKSNHYNNGENSQDPKQVAKVINDMAARGFDGASLNWYGYTAPSHIVAKLWIAELKLHPNFLFTVNADGGMFKYDLCGTVTPCTQTEQFIMQMKQAAVDLYSSPNYQRIGGKPVVFCFGLESYNLDWVKIETELPDLFFVIRNSSAFAKFYADGGYEWGAATSGTAAVDSFFTAAKVYPIKVAVGAFSKGFNDTLASWSANRIVDQQCGQRLLSLIAAHNKYTANTDWMQLVTWDDYEEGTEVESGVDNCVTITPSLSNQTLTWALTGTLSAIDHFEVYATTDGQNLKKLTDVAASGRSVDLSKFTLARNFYQIYVKVVGRPLFVNKMSAPTLYQNITGKMGTKSLTLTVQ